MSLNPRAREVLDLIERGFYEINDKQVSIESAVRNSLRGSRLYTPDELQELRAGRPYGSSPAPEVISGTTQQVASQLASDGPLVLLNFASARNPGGGFLNGAKAQEEDLCRCSALYPTLLEHPDYYETNRRQKSLLYTDYLIFSPDVPFFKIKGSGDLLPEPFLASVITAPAPNTRPFVKRAGDPRELEATFERRWYNVLAAAVNEQIPTILLGAWGCGAFGGDPVVASRTAARAVQDLGSGFPDSGRQGHHNYEAFCRQFPS